MIWTDVAVEEGLETGACDDACALIVEEVGWRAFENKKVDGRDVGEEGEGVHQPG